MKWERVINHRSQQKSYDVRTFDVTSYSYQLMEANYVPFDRLRNRNNCTDQLKRKEELPCRIRSDLHYRGKIREILATWFIPFQQGTRTDPEKMLMVLWLIFSGSVSPQIVDVDRHVPSVKVSGHFICMPWTKWYRISLQQDTITMQDTQHTILMTWKICLLK